MALLGTTGFTNGMAARMADTFHICCMHVKMEAEVELNISPQLISDETLLKYLSLTWGHSEQRRRRCPSERLCQPPNGRQDKHRRSNQPNSHLQIGRK
jgi:hypothetical protein